MPRNPQRLGAMGSAVEPKFGGICDVVTPRSARTKIKRGIGAVTSAPHEPNLYGNDGRIAPL